MGVTQLSESTRAVVDKFNDAFNNHDVDAIMSMMTTDCVFENTSPAPEGSRHEGQEEVRRFWEQFFADSPNAYFEVEDFFVAGDRCAVAWRYTWVGSEETDDHPGYVRGVDLFRVRDGKVSEKLSYVKG